MEEIKKLMSVVESSTDKLLASLPGYEFVSKIAKDSNTDVVPLLKAALLDPIEADLYVATDRYIYHVLKYSYVKEEFLCTRVNLNGGSEWKDFISQRSIESATPTTKEEYLKCIELGTSKCQ
jgi:hypothetical protein